MPAQSKVEVRQNPRSLCRLDSAIRYMKQEAACRIVNISRSGIAVEIYTAFHAAPGSTVSIDNQELGLLEGIVRWARGGRFGVQFRYNSNSSAKIDAYFRHFHREVRPVLQR